MKEVSPMRARGTCRGYSLLEAVIALFIGGIAAGGVLMFYLSTQNITRSTARQVVAKREGYGVIEVLAMRLREANLVQIWEEGTVLDITDPNGVTFRAYVDPGEDNNYYTSEDNTLRIIRDVDVGVEQTVARLISHRREEGGPQPFFSRVNNQITVQMRIGDAPYEEQVDQITGAGQQGYEVFSTVFLRNA